MLFQNPLYQITVKTKRNGEGVNFDLNRNKNEHDMATSNRQLTNKKNLTSVQHQM